MNSTINLITTDVDKSTVVVHKDGSDFNVPVKNMFQTVAQTGPSYEYLTPVYEYSACISSNVSGLTVHKVLKNTLGNVTFIKDGLGYYLLDCPDVPNLTGAAGVSWSISNLMWSLNFAENRYAIILDGNSYTTSNQLGFSVYDITNAPQLTDDGFQFYTFEVKVYGV